MIKQKEVVVAKAQSKSVLVYLTTRNLRKLPRFFTADLTFENVKVRPPRNMRKKNEK